MFKKKYTHEDIYRFKVLGLSTKEYIRALEYDIKMYKERLSDTIEDLYKEAIDYKIVFEPSSNLFSDKDKDYIIYKKRDLPKDRTSYSPYSFLKSYKTRKLAEEGLKLIKEELSKN